MKNIKSKRSAEILKSDIFTIHQTHTDMYAVWSSCNSRQKGKCGRRKGTKTRTKSRTENIGNLKRTFAKNRELINCNFNGGDNELFITLTYSNRKVKGKSGAQRFNKDFDSFMHTLKYLTFKGNKQKATKFLKWFTALEPQADGVWHAHCLLKWSDRKKIFISNQKIAKIWKQGFVKVNQIKDVDNVGAYLTAYLTNVVIDPKKATKSSKWTRNHKHMVEKGGRLGMYPAGIKLSRHSRNLTKPAKFNATGIELQKLAQIEGWKLSGCKVNSIKTDSVQKDGLNGELVPLVIETKQFYFKRSVEVAQRFKLIKQIAHKENKSVKEILNSMGIILNQKI